MGTTVPKESLRTLVASYSGLPVAVVLWDGEPKPPVGPSQDARRITLNVVARRKVGRDSKRREYPDANTIVSTYRGQRVVTVSIKAENMGQEEGFDLLELVRMQLDSEDASPALGAVGLSVNDTADVRNLDGSAGNRKISVAQLDVLFNQVVERVVTTAASGLNPSYIEEVELEGEAGTDLEGVEETVIAPPPP